MAIVVTATIGSYAFSAKLSTLIKAAIVAAGTAYSVHSSAKARDAAEREALENAFGSPREVPSGTTLPEVIGLAAVRGHPIWHKRTNFGAVAPGQIAGATWSGDPSRLSGNGTTSFGVILEAGTGQEGQYLALQDDICVGEIGSLLKVFFNERDSQDPNAEGRVYGFVITEIKGPGEVSAAFTSIDAERASAKFTGITHANNVLKFDPKDASWYGQPNTIYFVWPKPRRGLSASGFTAAASASSMSVVEELAHYLTVSELGPKRPDTSIHFASYHAANQIASRIVRGPGAPAAATALPPRRGTAFLGLETYDTWGDYDDDARAGDAQRRSAIFPSGVASFPYRRYQVFGTRKSGLSERQAISELLAVAPGAQEFVDYQGRHHIVLPDSETAEASQSVGTLTDRNVINDSFEVVHELGSRATQVVVNYLDVHRDMAAEQVIYPKPGSALETSLIAKNGGIRNVLTVDAPNVGTSYHANSLAANHLVLSWREKYRGIFDGEALNYSPGDILTLAIPSRGVDAFARVIAPPRPDEGGLRLVMQRMSKDDTAYRPTGEGDITITAPAGSALPDVSNVAAALSNGVVALTFDLEDSKALHVDGFDVQIKRNSTDAASKWEPLAKIDASAPSGTANGVSSYLYPHVPANTTTNLALRVRTFNENGNKGEFVASGNVAITSAVAGKVGGFFIYKRSETVLESDDLPGINATANLDANTIAFVDPDPNDSDDANGWSVTVPDGTGTLYERFILVTSATATVTIVPSQWGQLVQSTGRSITSVVADEAAGTLTINFNDGSSPVVVPLNDGKGYEFAGTWGTGNTYRFEKRLATGEIVTDVVFRKGSTYVALKEHESTTSNDPAETGGSEFWDLWAERGTGVKSTTRDAATGVVTITYDDGTMDSFTVSDGTDGTEGLPGYSHALIYPDGYAAGQPSLREWGFFGLPQPNSWPTAFLTLGLPEGTREQLEVMVAGTQILLYLDDENWAEITLGSAPIFQPVSGIATWALFGAFRIDRQRGNPSGSSANILAVRFTIQGPRGHTGLIGTTNAFSYDEYIDVTLSVASQVNEANEWSFAGIGAPSNLPVVWDADSLGNLLVGLPPDAARLFGLMGPGEIIVLWFDENNWAEVTLTKTPVVTSADHPLVSVHNASFSDYEIGRTSGNVINGDLRLRFNTILTVTSTKLVDGGRELTFSDGTTVTIPGGSDGKGIKSVARDASTGVVTVTFDDDTTDTFLLNDGVDGNGFEFIFMRKATSATPTAIRTTAMQDQTDDYVPTGWTDDTVDVDATNRYEFVSVRKGTTGAWGKFSTPTLWAVFSLDGTDGDNGDQGVQGLPGTSDSVDYSGYVETAPPGENQWSFLTPFPNRWAIGSLALGLHSSQRDKFRLMGPGSQFVLFRNTNNWCVYRVIDTGKVSLETINNVEYVLFTEIRIERFMGAPDEHHLNFRFVLPGADGPGVEFVFTRTATSDAPTAITTNAVQRATDDFVPRGWVDDPVGPTNALPYEWVSERIGSTKNWNEFSAPSEWALYVEDGADGEGTEYIFTRTATSTRPDTPTGFSHVDNYVPANWSAQPNGPTAALPYEWVSEREGTTGAWGKFSRPGEWAVFLPGEDGITPIICNPGIVLFATNNGTGQSRTVTWRKGDLSGSAGFATVTLAFATYQLTNAPVLTAQRSSGTLGTPTVGARVAHGNNIYQWDVTLGGVICPVTLIEN